MSGVFQVPVILPLHAIRLVSSIYMRRKGKYQSNFAPIAGPLNSFQLSHGFVKPFPFFR